MCRPCHKVARIDHLNANPGSRYKYKRRTELKNNYGMTEDDYNFILEAQQGVCKICGTDRADRRTERRFAIDHCHKTGKIRGLLCNTCNRALGLFKDSTSSLVNALNYLNYYKNFFQHGTNYPKPLIGRIK